MLPGVGIDAGDFAEHGFVSAAHERGLAADIVAVRPDLDHYLDNSVAAVLHAGVIEPALARGYTRVWLLGISLGGMGALLYASAYAPRVEGLVLLAPFLGTQGTVAEIGEAGGLGSWSSKGSAATAGECQILVWLQDFLVRSPERPALYLGYGRSDRFSRGHRLLAERMSTERVVIAEGGHDWPTWATIWQRVLESRPFGTHSR
jgi:pimeloyl-ACP methyl ester carboxylesterase